VIVKHQIANNGEKPILIRIEPWAEQYSVPPGSKLELAFAGPYDDPVFYTAAEEEGLVFTCGWDGSTFEVTLNGNRATPDRD
jgi:hypothetical protein